VNIELVLFCRIAFVEELSFIDFRSGPKSID